MQHCPHCFTFNRHDVDFCRRCHAPLQSASLSAAPCAPEPELVNTHQLNPTLEKGDLQPVGREGQWPWMLLVTSGMLLLLQTLFIPEAGHADWTWNQKSAAVEVPSTGEQRRTEVNEVAAALRQQRAALELHYSDTWLNRRARGDAWRAEWRRSCESLRSQYRIGGGTDASRTDTEVEEGLRNALLYLYSMEHLSSSQNAESRAGFEELGVQFEKNLAIATRR